MSTAQLAEDELPARDRLREAQSALAAALAAADVAAQALARGKEHLGVLERLRDEVKAEIVDEARSMAETFAETGVCAMIGGAAQRDREIKDELACFGVAYDILVQKNASAQAAIVDAESALASAVKGVIEEEVWPLLLRAQDHESAAAHLRSELRALQYCGKFGLAPMSLSARLNDEPLNVHHADRPLNWHQQKHFDSRKAAWVDFADRLRGDADAELGRD
jgi:hypothetical protein